MYAAKIAVIFAALVSLASGAAIGNGRQFTAADITGEYSQFVKQGSCAKTVGLAKSKMIAPGAYIVPHDYITQDGEACTSAGNFTVITKDVIIQTGNEFILESPMLKKVVDQLESQGATFMVGFERSERSCGATATSANSIAIFVEEEKSVTIPGLITLFQGAKYMIVYEPTSPTPCTYFQKTNDREIGTAEATATPIAAPAATPVPEEMAEPSSEAVTDGDDEAAIATAEADSGSDTSADNTTPGVVPVSVPGVTTPSSTPAATPAATPVDVVFDNEEEEPSPSPDADDEDDGSACFPGEATVELENGSMKRMDQLKIGDNIKVGANKYSPVFMFTHKIAEKSYEFVRIATTSGASITMTKGHYLYVNGKLAAAKTVRPGDMLNVEAGSTIVVGVSAVSAKGLYNPQTVQGDVIVNGIVSSTYTTTVEPKAAHAFLAPMRALFRVAGMSTSVFDNGADKVAQIVPGGAAVVA